jgi:translation initiation factor 2B subunit (eIF-2B alpha/beta/delta family)
MAALANRVNRAMATADGRSGAAVETCTQETIEQALDAGARAAERAARLLVGERVLTLSRSGTVRAALERADLEGIVVAESRPGGEGVGVAEELAANLDCGVTLCPDAAVAHLLADDAVDRVLVGADTLLADGRVVNKVGTRAAALAADREDVPCHAVAARAKVATHADPILEPAEPDDVYDGDAPLTVAAPLFDVTPADLLAGVVTERGVLDADAVAAVADEHRDLTDW